MLIIVIKKLIKSVGEIMKEMKGKVITIASGKGGVGKTIFATNLAGVYHYLKKKVLLVDMDLSSGGVNVLLNLSNTKTIYNLADDLLNNRFKEAGDYVYHYTNYIDILPSCKDPRQASKIDIKLLEQIITVYKNNYDVLLIDTTHIPTSYTLTALDLADIVLFIITDNLLDLKNSSSMLSILEEIKEDKVKVVLNDSYHQEKNYFSKYDIKSIIKHNIDYILPSSMYVSNINKSLMEGKVLVLNENLAFKNNSDRELLINLASKMVGDSNEK